MSASLGTWLTPWLATDAPALPSLAAMQFGLHLGWSVVLAWLGVVAVQRWWPGRPAGWRRLGGVALLLALWTWVSGPMSPAYWLGLAFQTPSVVTVLLCSGMLWEYFVVASGMAPQPGVAARVTDRWTVGWAVLGVLLGWALLLDTFALLPVQLYAWGFSPLALGLACAAALVPWVFGGGAPSGRVACWRPWVVAMALLVFVAVRLPTGNVWDAVLDPWLWLVLHGYLLRAVSRRYQK